MNDKKFAQQVIDQSLDIRAVEMWFAWYPVKTKNVGWVWLKLIKRRWNWDLNPWAYDCYSGSDGGWEYYGQ